MIASCWPPTRRAAARRAARRRGASARAARPPAGGERVHAKYRVGESLRVVYAIDAAPRRRAHVRGRRRAIAPTSGRSSRGRATRRCPRSCTPAARQPSCGRSRTTASWRRCRCWPTARAELAGCVGRPLPHRGSSRTPPSARRARAASTRAGRVIAYAKVLADGARRARAGATQAQPPLAAGLRVPRVLRRRPSDAIAIALEPIAGRGSTRCARRRLAGRPRGGSARRSPRCTRGRPLPRASASPASTPDRWRSAVAVIAPRPAAGGPAPRSCSPRCSTRRRPRHRPAVCLHGDVEPAQRDPRRRGPSSRSSTSSTRPPARPPPTSGRCSRACSPRASAARIDARTSARSPTRCSPATATVAPARRPPRCAGTPPPRAGARARCRPSTACGREVLRRLRELLDAPRRALPVSEAPPSSSTASTRSASAT